LLRSEASCARCGGGLKTVHNRSRWGASLQLECVARHGAYQTFAQFLEEKGLLRPMSHLDRVRLIEQRGRIDCVNCGAAIGAQDERCPYCRSVANLLDVARLARALDPEGVIEPQAVNGAPAQQGAKQCGACGAALPPGQTLGCTQCGATLAISRLAEAVERVNALAPALRAHAIKPAPDVVRRRLEALDADLPRQREWARNMESEARQQLGGDGEETDWRALFGRKTNPLRAVLLALAIWFVWWFW
jgi:predicted nucleic acid-binding Zn ribbon protein